MKQTDPSARRRRRRRVRAAAGPRGPGDRWRRLVAALLAALAAGTVAYLATGRPAADSVQVVVAAEVVPVGSVLGPEHVQARELPEDAVPDEALGTLEDVVGRSVTTTLRPGEVLTPGDLHLPSLLAGQPPDTVAAYLTVSDRALVGAIQAGDRVDIHSPVDGRAVVQVARVVAVDPGENGAGGGFWLALDPRQVVALAEARGADPLGLDLFLAVHPP